ncbi:MAG: hypothetical protein Q7R52_02600 [archaeon]|nr:hypothetical protein [archaeon]
MVIINDPLIYVFLADNNFVLSAKTEDINISVQGNIVITDGIIISGSWPVKKRFVSDKITIKTHIRNVIIAEGTFEI